MQTLKIAALLATTLMYATGYAASVERLDTVPLVVMPAVSVPQPSLQKSLSVDKTAAADDVHLMRFAQGIDTFLSLDDGVWKTLTNGSEVWRLRIQSVSASSLSVGFTYLQMPEGSSIRLKDMTGQTVAGPFYSETYNPLGQLWTPIVKSDAVLIEFIGPPGSRQALDLTIGQVNHGYLKWWNQGLGYKSGSCNVDVACAEANNWRDEVRSVARIQLSDPSGSFLCSAVLLNNTKEDFRPYLYTAEHCLPTNSYGDDSAATVVAYWNYESNTCGGANGSTRDTTSGAFTRARWGATDFALLELVSMPRVNYAVNWAGWDRRDSAPRSGVGIHHPSGHEKSISLDFNPLQITSAAGYSSPGDARYLRVVAWDKGVTERGSSGSPFFSQNKQVVGQLSLGASECGTHEYQSDWYGRFAKAWDGGGLAVNRLKDWLDPQQSNLWALQGRDINGMTGGETVAPSDLSNNDPSATDVDTNNSNQQNTAGSGSTFAGALGGNGGGGSAVWFVFLLAAIKLWRQFITVVRA